VQAEITRTRLRRSCGISSDRSVIATAPPSQQLLGPLYGRANIPAIRPSIQAIPQFRPPSVRLPTLVFALCAGLFCICEWPNSARAGRSGSPRQATAPNHFRRDDDGLPSGAINSSFLVSLLTSWFNLLTLLCSSAGDASVSGPENSVKCLASANATSALIDRPW
jgi:hypothetical protein